MLNYNVKIGLAPFRRDVTPRPGIFNWEKAESRGREIVEYIKNNFTDDRVSFIDTAGLTPVDILINEEDALAAAQRFKAEKVDAVFIINTNFGNEEAGAVLAREMDKPVLIWAPLDDEYAPDGMRFTDSQCGLFGLSRQLQRCNIPFSHVGSCKASDELFARELQKFISVACMVKNFKNMRVAQVGMRPKPFCSVIFNEGELMQKLGIYTIPVNMVVVTNRYNIILNEQKDEIKRYAALINSRYEMDDLTPPLVDKMAAFVLLYQWITQEYKVDAISSECWTSMQLAVGAMPCTAFSILADMGYIVGCESDMHGTITMALLRCATLGRCVPFFGEFTVRHPEDENTELLWHCGPFAYSLKAPDSAAQNVNMRQWFRVKDGGYTIARLDQDNGNYTLLSGTCRSAEGPHTFGTYLWARFENLPAWEKKLIEGPYIHHMAEIEGDYTAELREFCKYIPKINIDEVCLL